ncbi:MAG: PAS domain S-box protein, partial [Flavipsychrobacter sp.]
VNAAAINYYGYSSEEFLRMTIQDIRPKEDIATQVEVVKMPVLNSFYDSSRRRHMKKNGEIFYTQVYSHATHFAGKAARVMLAMDINNRVLIEQRNQELNQMVREHKDKLDDILSSVTEVIWSCDAKTRNTTYINDACQEVYGYMPDELLNNTKILSDIVHPDDRYLVENAFKNIAKNRKAVFEYRVYHKDGSLKYIINQAIYKEGRGGQPAVINGIAVDITRLKAMEEALTTNRNEMQIMLESITDGFFAVNTRWDFTYVNKETEKLFSRGRHELLGTNLWEHIPNAADLQFYNELHRAIEQQVSVHFEEYVPAIEKWLSVNAYPAKDGLAVYFRDVTEEKDQLLRIESQNKVLRDIAWIQSHKVRGPVANILGLAQLFNYNNPADPINKEILDGLRVSTNELDEIIKEVVDKTNITITA